MRAYSCDFLVMKQNNYGHPNYPYEYVETAGKKKYGDWTNIFKGDKYGHVTIEWYSNNDLEFISIDGERYYGPFEDGGSYRILIPR